jgi:hypothetical protein
LVADLVDQREADRRMGYQTFEAKYHAFASDVSETREVSLMPVAERLRFVSRDRPLIDLGKSIGGQLQRIRKLDASSATLVSELWSHAAQRELDEYDAIPGDLDRFKELDVQRQITARAEQDFLRRLPFGTSPTGECILCGKKFPRSLLVAAHIKPRADCSDEERRDFRNNVAAMCLFGCDALFERGVASVSGGRVRVHRDVFSHDLPSLLEEIDDRPVPFCTPTRERYFRWHSELGSEA